MHVLAAHVVSANMEEENKTRQQLVEEALANSNNGKTWNSLGKALGEAVLQRLKDRDDLGKVLGEAVPQRLKGRRTTIMRLGKVYISSEYVVDLDNESMVNDAKICISEDIVNAVKYNELESYIKVKEDAGLFEADIPEFLIGDGTEEN